MMVLQSILTTTINGFAKGFCADIELWCRTVNGELTDEPKRLAYILRLLSHILYIQEKVVIHLALLGRHTVHHAEVSLYHIYHNMIGTLGTNVIPRRRLNDGLAPSLFL